MPWLPPVPLKLPQARALSVLANGSPRLTRAKLAERCGLSPVSGTVTRVLHGLREGSSSGAAHPGLLALGLVVPEELDVDGEVELTYRITPAGRAALEGWLAEGNELPALRDSGACVNKRYRSPGEKRPAEGPAEKTRIEPRGMRVEV